MVRGFLIASVLLAAAPVWADTILLKDGRSFTGSLVRQGDQMSIKTSDGKIVPVTSDSIQKVTLDTAQSPADKANADWSRVQAQIRTSAKLADIVALLQAFVDQHPNTAVTATATQSLADYQKMKQDNYVKVRDKWVPKDQAEIMVRQADDKAHEAMALYKASKLKDAVAAGLDCLAVDDHNATALTVLGLASFKLNQVADAKNYFTKLTDADPNNALGWNNLGVLSFGQKHETDGLTFYTKALQAAMDNRLILDNISSAMLSYSGSHDAQVYKGLARIDEQSEVRVGAKMREQGLYRYKGTWVTQEQRDRLTGQNASVSGQLSQDQQQYSAAQASLTAIDVEIRKNQEAIQRANSDYASASSIIDYNTSRRLYVDPYYFNLRDAATADLQRANQQRQALEDQRAQVTDAIRKLKAEVDRLTTALANDPDRVNNTVQRLMEPGDLENPPPPAPVDIPPKVETGLIPSPQDIQASSSTPSQASSLPPPVGTVVVGPTRIVTTPNNNNNGSIITINPGGAMQRR